MTERTITFQQVEQAVEEGRVRICNITNCNIRYLLYGHIVEGNVWCWNCLCCMPHQIHIV